VDGATRKPREHGPTTLLTSKGAKAKTGDRKVDTSANEVSATTPFNAEHVSLENCLNTPQVDPPGLGGKLEARIQERPYSMCHSAYYYMQDFFQDPTTKLWKRVATKTTWGKIAKAAGELFDDDAGLKFRATYVMHSYLGNAAGTGVENGAGSGLVPQNFKLFTRLDKFAIEDEDGNYLASGDEIDFKLEVQQAASPGATCTLQSGSSQNKKIKAWRTDPDDEFLFRVRDTDGDKLDECAFAPFITQTAGDDVTLPLWSEWEVDDDGMAVDIVRGGDGTASDHRFVPRVRCDWSTFDETNDTDETENARLRAAAADGTVEVHTGACINLTASRIFNMSKSRNASFLQVIEHIEAALKQDGPNNPAVNDNKFTVPPLRDNETQNPPVKGLTGTEKTKSIKGNWAAPHDVLAGQPLERAPAGTAKKVNRPVFSRSFRLNGVTYGNYCQYYFPNSYLDPLRWQLDPKGQIQCDEYPFASTKEGAGFAKGNYSVRAVGKAHNTGKGSHGAALGSFYSRYRVSPGDKYWVLISS
jgi:Deoxyribonuclease NucA/NucB